MYIDSSLRLLFNDLKKIFLSSKAALLQYTWPGNTRELLHELERAIVMHERNELLTFNFNRNEATSLNSKDWLNSSFHFPEEGFELEKEMLRLINMAIRQSNGNISEAARMLGVPRDYIRYRLKKQN